MAAVKRCKNCGHFFCDKKLEFYVGFCLSVLERLSTSPAALAWTANGAVFPLVRYPAQCEC